MAGTQYYVFCVVVVVRCRRCPHVGTLVHCISTFYVCTLVYLLSSHLWTLVHCSSTFYSTYISLLCI
jgi:hypothetical protein